ncbi:MAG: hypothetical protein HY901_02270 [Deltaproteobacteria bacterium]|nr:hypothetical protein [Deltaproteobacteria bacterium]
MTVELGDVYREVESVLRMKPLAEEARGFQLVVRVVFLPSFDPECGMTFFGRDEEAVLSIHSAKRSIWAYLNAKKGVAGFTSADAWVEPSVGNEVIKLGCDDLRQVFDLVRGFESSTGKYAGMGLDGMPARIEVRDEGMAAGFAEIWFSADANTPPGRLAGLLSRLATANCTWDLTRATVAALQKYGCR